MAGRDSLPHFPGPKEFEQQQHNKQQQRPPSGNKMYQPPYQQNPVPGGYPTSPAGGYQVGPPGSGYGQPAPPPQQGYQPAPQQGYQAPNQGYSQRPVSGHVPVGVDPQLWAQFKQADINRNGQLSEKELGKALVNSDWTPFDSKTVKLMVKMFDADHNGTISYQEFVRLWEYLDQWRGLFRRFDKDNSNAIDRVEFGTALVDFGYRLSDKFTNLLFASYDKRGDGQISFDMFVQSMVTLKTLTDVFKDLDKDRDGYITIGFEQFLEVILRQR